MIPFQPNYKTLYTLQEEDQKKRNASLKNKKDESTRGSDCDNKFVTITEEELDSLYKKVDVARLSDLEFQEIDSLQRTIKYLQSLSPGNPTEFTAGLIDSAFLSLANKIQEVGKFKFE